MSTVESSPNSLKLFIDKTPARTTNDSGPRLNTDGPLLHSLDDDVTTTLFPFLLLKIRIVRMQALKISNLQDSNFSDCFENLSTKVSSGLTSCAFKIASLHCSSCARLDTHFIARVETSKDVLEESVGLSINVFNVKRNFSDDA